MKDNIRAKLPHVMAGLEPAIHAFPQATTPYIGIERPPWPAWMPGTRPGMTVRHGEESNRRTCMRSDLRCDPTFALLLTGSYRRLVGRPLADLPANADHAKWLYADAPFCLLAHDTQPDPVFIYANEAAQRRFGYDWDAFITLPSRLSAEAPDRAERARLLEAVTRDGFIADYRGVRIAKSGRRFIIEEAVVWELRDAAGLRHGQAAAFSRWRDVDA